MSIFENENIQTPWFILFVEVEATASDLLKDWPANFLRFSSVVADAFDVEADSSDLRPWPINLLRLSSVVSRLAADFISGRRKSGTFAGFENRLLRRTLNLPSSATGSKGALSSSLSVSSELHALISDGLYSLHRKIYETQLKSCVRMTATLNE